MKNIRTDMALDIAETNEKNGSNAEKSVRERDGLTVTEITVKTDEDAAAFGKPKGRYITIEFDSLFKLYDTEPLKNEIKSALESLCEKDREKFLFAGLGNKDITPDAIGPFVSEKILATRHIAGAFAESLGLEKLKSVAVITPGVFGKTGIETGETVALTVKSVAPDLVVAVDALASSSVKRLYRSVQLCNSGISPGSGVKNSRKEISEATLNVPVIAVGVPTVVDAAILAKELTGYDSLDTDMFVTPKEADLFTEKISVILSDAVNEFFQPDTDPSVIKSLF